MGWYIPKRKDMKNIAEECFEDNLDAAKEYMASENKIILGVTHNNFLNGYLKVNYDLNEVVGIPVLMDIYSTKEMIKESVVCLKEFRDIWLKTNSKIKLSVNIKELDMLNECKKIGMKSVLCGDFVEFNIES